jgi:hypothetical protein
MVTTQNSQSRVEDLDARIDRMHKRDRLGALAFVIALWVTVLFALVSVWPLVTVPMLRTILLISGGLVLIFNTASIWAMLRHYADDRDFIYGLDLKHLDEMRRQKRI